MLVVARSSALDTYTNNWCLFHLVEDVQLASVPASLPLDILQGFVLERDEVGREYSIRIVLLREEEVEWAGRPHTGPFESARVRARATQGLEVPSAGNYKVAVEWREAGNNDIAWVRADVRWPLTVRVLGGEEED